MCWSYLVTQGDIMTDQVRELSDATFYDTLKNTKTMIMVEFYTRSCPNCRVMEPILEEVAREMGKDVVVARIDAGKSPVLATFYGVMGVPTFKFFCTGQPIGELVGAVPGTMLKNTIKDLIRVRSECVSKSSPLSSEITGYG